MTYDARDEAARLHDDREADWDAFWRDVDRLDGHGPLPLDTRLEARSEHAERLATDPDYRAEVAYREAGGTDPQGPAA